MVTSNASAEAAPGTSILHLTIALSLADTLRKVRVLFVVYSPSSTLNIAHDLEFITIS